MRFIKITEDIQVNPDFISTIEFRNQGKTKILVVKVDGREIISSVDPMELFADLTKCGMENDGKNNQMWVG